MSLIEKQTNKIKQTQTKQQQQKAWWIKPQVSATEKWNSFFCLCVYEPHAILTVLKIIEVEWNKDSLDFCFFSLSSSAFLCFNKRWKLCKHQEDSTKLSRWSRVCINPQWTSCFLGK